MVEATCNEADKVDSEVRGIEMIQATNGRRYLIRQMVETIGVCCGRWNGWQLVVVACY